MIRQERQIGIVNLEEDRYVRIVCSVGLDTECALKWAEAIIALKRRELGEGVKPVDTGGNDDTAATLSRGF